MKIWHDIKIQNRNTYFLNGVRIWHSATILHIGDSNDPANYMSSINNSTLHGLVLALLSDSGHHEIDLTNPVIKQFLELTKCI